MQGYQRGQGNLPIQSNVFNWLPQTVSFIVHWKQQRVSISISEAMVLCWKLTDCSLSVWSWCQKWRSLNIPWSCLWMRVKWRIRLTLESDSHFSPVLPLTEVQSITITWFTINLNHFKTSELGKCVHTAAGMHMDTNTPSSLWTVRICSIFDLDDLNLVIHWPEFRLQSHSLLYTTNVCC